MTSTKNSSDLSNGKGNGGLGSLPTAMYFEIRTFLNNPSYYKLISTSKAIFEKIKFETRKICLHDPKEIQKFINAEKFRQTILEKIQTPYNQLLIAESESPNLSFQVLNIPIKCDLDLSFSNFNDDETFVPQENLPSMSNLSGRNCVRLYGHRAVTHFNGLCDIKEMKVSHFHALVDVGGLKNLYKLTLVSCHSVTDISCLGHLQELNILFCPGITTTMGLGNVPRLELFILENLVSLDPSSNHKRLCISTCKRFVASDSNISHLRNVSYLAIDRINKFEQLDKLLAGNDRLQSLVLSNYGEEEPHPLLGKLKLVVISSSSIKSLNHLKDVPTLSFDACGNLKDISSFAGASTRSVAFRYCTNIKDFAPLRGIPSITIHTRNWYAFPDMTVFSDSRHLSLICDTGFDRKPLSFEGVDHLEHLEVNNYDVTDVPPSVSLVELGAQDYYGMKRFLTEMSNPRIVLKDGVYERFMEEVKVRLDRGLDPEAFRTGPYELLDDPTEKRAILLKNWSYKDSVEGGEEEAPARFSDDLLYYLFRIKPKAGVAGKALAFSFSAGVSGFGNSNSNPFSVGGSTAPSSAPAPAFPVSAFGAGVGGFGISGSNPFSVGGSTDPLSAPAPVFPVSAFGAGVGGPSISSSNSVRSVSAQVSSFSSVTEDKPTD